MKKTLLFLLLFTGMVNAQIVNIPDANFKAALIAKGVDTNSDGNIQNSEALNVSSLSLNGSMIADLTGISSFKNLNNLNCINNSISNLNLTGLSNLQILKIGESKINTLDLTGVSNLTELDCSDNRLTNLNGLSVKLTSLDCSRNYLTTLDVTSLVNLVTLNCSLNPLTTLDLNPNLTTLNCSSNILTTLDVTPLVNLVTLNCGGNALTTLDVTPLVNLTNLACAGNQLTSLDVTPLVKLSYLKCSFNQLTSLDVTSLVNLNFLDCSSNQLTSLDVTPLVNLSWLDCSSNQLTILDVTPLVNLQFLLCSSNQLTILDVTPLVKLNNIVCRFNNLTSLNFKNNPIFLENSQFDGNPNLKYICVEEYLIVEVQSLIDQYEYTNCHVNSYCSFVPGGAYNTIKGNCKLDSDVNGCDANDAALQSLKMKINDGTTNGATIVNTAGDYAFYTEAGSFTVTPQLENPAYFTVSPTDAVVDFLDANETKLQDFCLTANGVHPDLEIVLAPIGPARPGFDVTYRLVYKNKGNQPLSGTVSLTFDDDRIDFISANPAVSSQATTILSWDYATLQPYESRSINLVFNVNSPQETPAVNIGDILNFTTSITPVDDDSLPLDNQFILNQTVVGSYDPNDITCLEGEVVAPSQIGKYLHYVINFENTGTYEAENIVVKCTIDPAKYDIDSLQLLFASDEVYTRINGDVIEFIFKNIKLGIGGHGNILLKMKSNEALVLNDMIFQKANIYFDYNFPIITNNAETVFKTLSNSGFVLDANIAISPNPATTKINIKANTAIKSMHLYDIQGRIIETLLGNTTVIDISNKQNGIYFLKVTTDKGSKVEKIIKN